jgi:hypothetical protein
VKASTGIYWAELVHLVLLLIDTMDFQDTPDYHGYTEINLNAALIGLTTLFFGTRIYVRAFMTKTLGLDDAFASVAYLLLVAQSALDIRGKCPSGFSPDVLYSHLIMRRRESS